jgi:hypothetical protein
MKKDYGQDSRVRRIASVVVAQPRRAWPIAPSSLTPHQYREKWKLPYDYPMVAPNYAAQRSAMAKKIGLGRTRSAGT